MVLLSEWIPDRQSYFDTSVNRMLESGWRICDGTRKTRRFTTNLEIEKQNGTLNLMKALITHFSFATIGGAERVALKIAVYLREVMGMEVEVGFAIWIIVTGWN